ncbi:4Fe-4S ferredoxin iron-sulfur binding domain-containing protein [Caldalkalibacillus thermarum TA2.A1]|uniref:4Fe-4S dicluster domain-containing protein n=1 Tax=Caldalkalibacillus thermarum (strain TA2.A1) TaxID=986075 RepID=F5L7M6_CALTT|nr:4Fe-4S dicluster domain-containing protein [Caldalkalibacillus thermarum]EGL82670.1 4Fe-4S ferredoxin iron-sulfur binding domain-containing protein [Caldalkalibacillus thermarum TA2.A1]QZT33387.1 4Fe-4S dicluster domain-containing protein [Caldalkalibacillus thermarum TA2.A1]
MADLEARKGMFIDTSICIGCKACETACKEWNELPMNPNYGFSGQSYDNTQKLNGENWRHVKFIEDFSEDRSEARWLFLSDSCKHCQQAGCMEVCPTNAIIRTEYDTVYIDPNVCIGCKYCVSGCPFGVIDIGLFTGTAEKCTLCYDRLQVGQQPACAQACPTDCIEFGDVDELMAKAKEREKQLQANGESRAQIYGDSDILGGLNVFYLLLDKPEKYGLPANPQLPQKNMLGGYWSSILSFIGIGLVSLLSFRTRGQRKQQEETQDVNL